MAIEGIGGAGMVYQGSTSTSAVRTEAQPKVDVASNAETSAVLEQNTLEITTNKASGEGNGSSPNGSLADQQRTKNAQIKKAIEELNKSKIGNSEAIFGIHDETNRVTIKIVDKTTKDVLKEYPAEKTLDMIAKVWEMAGIMVDEKR